MNETASNDNQPLFAEGDRVFHPKFGNGTVAGVRTTDRAEHASVSVDWDSNSVTSNIVASFLSPSDTPAPEDDTPARMERLRRLQKLYGGEVHQGTRHTGPIIYGAKVGTDTCNIGIDAGGQAYTFTMKGGRVPLPEPEPLFYISPAEWAGKPIPERAWYIPDLIPMRQVTILNGDGGVGKSLLALQLGAAGALQCETLDIRPLPGRVMYLGAEDEADEFHRRLADIVYAHQRELSDLTDFMLLPLADADALLSIPNPKSGVMEPTPLWLAFADDARDFRPKMIVLDTVADLFGGDEIRRAQVRQFISMLRKLAIEIDCAIVLLAHPSVAGMASGTGSSGSTAWNNSVRSRLYLTRPESKDEDPDMRVMKTMKANYGKTGGEIRLRWCEGAFILDDGRATPTAGLLNRKHEETFMNVLAKFLQRGVNVSANSGPTYAPSKFASDPEGKGSNKRQLADAMARLLDAGKIKMETFGPASRERSRLVIA